MRDPGVALDAWGDVMEQYGGIGYKEDRWCGESSLHTAYGILFYVKPI